MSGSQPWLPIGMPWGDLKNINAWVPAPEGLISLVWGGQGRWTPCLPPPRPVRCTPECSWGKSYSERERDAEPRTNSSWTYSENNPWMKLLACIPQSDHKIPEIILSPWVNERISLVSDCEDFPKTFFTKPSGTVAPSPAQAGHIFGIITGAL